MAVAPVSVPAPAPIPARAQFSGFAFVSLLMIFTIFLDPVLNLSVNIDLHSEYYKVFRKMYLICSTHNFLDF